MTNAYRDQNHIPTMTAVLNTDGKTIICLKTTLLSQGSNSPGTVVDDSTTGTKVWSNPNNAKVSDNVYATVLIAYKNQSHYLKATNFGFAIPIGATIKGIITEIECTRSSSNIYENSIKIVKSNGSFGSTNKSTQAYLPSTDTYLSYGSTTDLWNEIWTVTDINDVNFGVGFSFFGIGTCYVDHIRITVYFSLSSNRLGVIDGITGSDFGPTNEARDENNIPVLMAVSSVDEKTPIPLYADKDGNLLIQSS